jgi:hypothetical protein
MIGEMEQRPFDRRCPVLPVPGPAARGDVARLTLP